MMKKSLLFLRIESRRPLYKAIYKINEKGIETKLSERIGTNQASFNPSCTYFINKYSNSNEPLLVTVCDAKGKVIRTLEDNATLKARIAQTDLPRKNFYLPQSRRRSNERLYFETHEFRPLETLSGSHDPIQRTGFPIGSG